MMDVIKPAFGKHFHVLDGALTTKKHTNSKEDDCKNKYLFLIIRNLTTVTK